MPSEAFELLEYLGGGRFGEVFRARHVVLDRVVALKLLRPFGPVEVMLEEAKKLAAMPEHDNVLKVHDAGVWTDGRVYIAAEYCDGGTLEDAGVLTPTDACQRVAEASRGLDHIHEQDLLHLDVRPANLLLSTGVVKLADFGLSRWITDPTIDEWYQPHAAPELYERGRADRASDVWAIGMTLAHLLTGGLICRPFPTGAQLVEDSVDGLWPRLSSLPPHIPQRVRAVVKRATSYDPAKRPQTARDCKQAIDKATPALSLVPTADGYAATDGEHTVVVGSNRNGWFVDVRKNGRRKSELSVTGLDVDAVAVRITALAAYFGYG